MSFCLSRSLVTARVNTHPFRGRKKHNPECSLVPNNLLIRRRRERQCREVTRLMLQVIEPRNLVLKTWQELKINYF